MLATLVVLLSVNLVHATDSIDDDAGAWVFTDGSITFVCVDRDNNPVQDAKVEHAEWDSGLQPLEGNVLRARTGAGGKCRFDNLSGGKTISAHAQKDGLGCWMTSRQLKPSDKNPTVTLTLDVHRELCGKVVDRAGNAIPDVQIDGPGGLRGAVSDSTGAFCLRHLQGHQTFSFYKEGYGWTTSTFASYVDLFELPMPKGGTLEVTVLDSQGRPVSGAEVRYTGSNVYYGGEPGATAVTNGQGKAETVWLSCEHKVPVRATLVRDGQRWTARSAYQPRPGTSTPVTIQLPAESQPMPGFKGSSTAAETGLRARSGGVVTGRAIMEGSGEPVLASILFDTSHEWVRSVRAITNDDGTFRCDGLAMGTYYFTAFPRSAALYNKGGLVQVELSEEQPSRELTFTIVEGCALRGDVMSADGLPVARAQIVYAPANPNHYYPSITDEMGHFFIPHLAFPNRTYSLTIHSGHGKAAKVEAGPIGHGKISDPLAVTLDDVYLAPATAGELHGQVIDQDGAPVSGASVSLPPHIAPGSSTTDSAGRYVLKLRQDGEGTITVSRNVDIYVNGVMDSFREMLAVLEGGVVRIDGDNPQGLHRVRVEVQPWKYVGGYVTDTEDNPLSPDVWVYAEDCMGTGHAENGAFLRTGCSKPFEKDPVLLEFKLKGYQARVLESGRDFELGDTRLRVVMKKGPYEPFESIFEAVTGRPVTEAGTMFRGDRILEETYEYWNLANGRSGRVDNPSNRIIVKNLDGSPVTRIFARTRIENRPTVLSTVEESGFPLERMENHEGHFTLSDDRNFVWSEGTGMVFVSFHNREWGAEPRVLVLQPASRLTVRIVDAQGDAVRGVTVGLNSTNPAWPRYIDSSPPYPRTTITGTIEYAHLPPGEYEVWAYHPGYDRTSIDVKLPAGITKTLEIALANRTESASLWEWLYYIVMGWL
jgi:hypothetical protein